ncbi:MAG: isoprenylcysteine carboxylmethyltransferase family protein [Pseudomonadota bacterium]
MAELRPIPRVLTSLGYGALTHVAFGLGVGSMVLCMGFGMQLGQGPFAGWLAWAVNALLLLQFPLGHSFFLTGPGRAWLARLSPAPGDDAKTLAITTYALIASIQLFVLFWGWSPTGTVWWQASGGALYAMLALYAAAWGFLGLAILNGGIGLQSGFIGWWALLRDRAPNFPDMPTRYLYAVTRNPIYLAFTCTLWTVPTWSPDQLFVALAWTLYCVLAPRLKEKRFLKMHGDRFARYQGRVPYFLPFPKACKDGQRHPAE